jgi:hypothetical protein
MVESIADMENEGSRINSALSEIGVMHMRISPVTIEGLAWRNDMA